MGNKDKELPQNDNSLKYFIKLLILILIILGFSIGVVTFTICFVSTI